MGASDSKLVFKQGIFRLSEPALIPEDDPYWTGVSAHLPNLARLALICLVLGAARIDRRCILLILPCRHS